MILNISTSATTRISNIADTRSLHDALPISNYLRSCVENVHYNQYNKTQGQPFTVNELKECFIKLLEE